MYHSIKYNISYLSVTSRTPLQSLASTIWPKYSSVEANFPLAKSCTRIVTIINDFFLILFYSLFYLFIIIIFFFCKYTYKWNFTLKKKYVNNFTKVPEEYHFLQLQQGCMVEQFHLYVRNEEAWISLLHQPYL